MERTEILIAKAQVYVELPGELPLILEVEVVSVYLNKTLWISHSNCRRRDIAGEEVSERLRGCIDTVVRPWTLSAVKDKFSSSTARIELIHAGLTKLASEARLVLTNNVGNNVREVAGDVIAAFRRGESDLFKASDSDVWSAQDRLAVIGGIGAQEQAQGFGIEAIVEIVKDLIEVIDADQHLIGQT